MSDTTLTFDVDDVKDMGIFVEFVKSVLIEHGEKIWIRKSSSGSGFHLKVVSGTYYNEETGCIEFREQMLNPARVLEIRKNTEGVCQGRLKGDIARFGAGMNVGRLFYIKTGKVCGEWIPAKLFLEHPQLI